MNAAEPTDDPATDDPATDDPATGGRVRLPLWAKLLYTAFLAVLVPVYWRDYGPTNFLYFCDVALVLTLAAFWTGRSLPASMAAVGILLPQLLWCIDFAAVAAGGQVTGMTAYMFDEKLTLFARGLSLFHGWLPFVLLALVWKLGYDRRALVWWTLLAWVLLPACYLFLPTPPAPPETPGLPVNVNYVYGLDDGGPQRWMPPLAWLAAMMVALPTLLYLPTHLLLRAAFAEPAKEKRPQEIPDIPT